jgi:hypothetical protein
MSSQCQCKRGFFALRNCGQPASRQCITCQRFACADHLAPSKGYMECLDCAARAGEKKVAEPDVYDDEWAYRYRHGYYRRGYAPIYWGHHDRYYDSYDARPFHASSTTAVHDADERASFKDS